jgi:hypothetical protein
MAAILVAEREEVEEIANGLDARGLKHLGAALADSFDELDESVGG